jgi:hypothetical protein
MVSKKRLEPYIPLMISLSLGLVLYFLVNDFVVVVFVKPLLRAIWYISLFVQSLSQGVLWVGFIFIMLVVTYANLSKGEKTTSSALTTTATNTGTVEIWARMLENAQTSKYSRWRLAQRLKRLTQKLLSPFDQDSRGQMDLSGLELPEEISAYFEVPHPSIESLWERLLHRGEEPETALDLDPEIVIQHLQERLNS